MVHCRFTTINHFCHCNSADFLREKANKIQESALDDSAVPKEIPSQISLRAFLSNSDRQQAAGKKGHAIPRVLKQ